MAFLFHMGRKGAEEMNNSIIIIKKNDEYKKIYNKKNSISDYYLVLFICKNNTKYNRYGFTTAKKIKKAVTRNKIRRRLKDIVRKNKANIKTGYDIILMARLNSINASYKDLEKSYIKILKKKNLYLNGE